MVEKMKMVHIVTSASAKEEMLEGLRDIGVFHLAEKQSADREVADRFQTMSRVSMALKDYAEPKQKPVSEVLTDDEFNKMYDGVLEAMDRKSALAQEISAANTEIDRISAWGEFSPEELKDLREEGYDFHFYRMGSKEFEALKAEEDVRFLRLAPVEKQDAVAVFGTLPASIQATEFIPGDNSISELKQQIEDANNGIKECDSTLKAASVYDHSFKKQLLNMQNEVNYSAASATAQGDDDFVWISGYVPEVDLDKVKTMAAEKKCAWAIEDVAEDDDKIPTKLRFNKVSKLIEPVFDILGVLPGYREQDVSLWFLLFFTLFFAMIIGDGGYGGCTHPDRNDCAQSQAEERQYGHVPSVRAVDRNCYMGCGYRYVVRNGECDESTAPQGPRNTEPGNISGLLRTHSQSDSERDHEVLILDRRGTDGTWIHPCYQG